MGADGRGVFGATGCVRPNSYEVYVERNRQRSERTRRVYGELCCPFNLSYRRQPTKVHMGWTHFLILTLVVGVRGTWGPMIVAFPEPRTASTLTPTGLYRAQQADIRKVPSCLRGTMLLIQSILSKAADESSYGSVHFLDLISRRRCP